MTRIRLLTLLFPIFASFACSGDHGQQLIANIEAGNTQTLKQLPETVRRINPSLNDEQSAQLVQAIGFALVKNPKAVLQSTDVMDKDKDTLVQRFGTGAVCALPIDMDYTRDSTFHYYKLASDSLIEAGLLAKECLSIMQASMDEVNATDIQGHMNWGNKIYIP